MRSNHRRIRRLDLNLANPSVPTGATPSASADPGNANGDGNGKNNGTGNESGNGSGSDNSGGAQSSSQSTQTSVSATNNGGGGGHRSSSTKQAPSTTSTSSETPPTTTKSSSSTTSSAATSSTTSLSVQVTPSSHSSSSVKTTGPTNAKATGTTPLANGDVETQPVLTTAPGTTVSAASTDVGAAGSVNVGAVVGGVAGGIAGVALIFFIVMYLLRRRRERGESFDPMSFRKSAVMVNDTADPFNPRPPTMIERHVNGHNVAPSISSIQAANMAGAGAYGAYEHEAEEQQYDAQAYVQAQQAQSQSHGHQPLQPRQQYTYGQSYAHNTYAPEGSDHGHGAEYNGPYSSEPHAQDIYAAEAYAYPGEDQVVVSPGMRAQEMGHYQQTHDAYGGM